mmetsp:Transcript_1033/g.4630  ORF Transcript_1033/g.4630 Transcript_1033/m.4630 type:complete len:578 (-) Transcript_1033:646-2379(-)
MRRSGHADGPLRRPGQDAEDAHASNRRERGHHRDRPHRPPGERCRHGHRGRDCHLHHNLRGPRRHRRRRLRPAHRQLPGAVQRGGTDRGGVPQTRRRRARERDPHRTPRRPTTPPNDTQRVGLRHANPGVGPFLRRRTVHGRAGDHRRVRRGRHLGRPAQEAHRRRPRRPPPGRDGASHQSHVRTDGALAAGPGAGGYRRRGDDDRGLWGFPHRRGDAVRHREGPRGGGERVQGHRGVGQRGWPPEEDGEDARHARRRGQRGGGRGGSRAGGGDGHQREAGAGRRGGRYPQQGDRVADRRGRRQIHGERRETRVYALRVRRLAFHDSRQRGPPGRPRYQNRPSHHLLRGPPPPHARQLPVHPRRDPGHRRRDAGRADGRAEGRQRYGRRQGQKVLPPLLLPAVVRGRDRADGRGESTGGWAREPSGTCAHAGHPELRRLSVHGEAGVDHHGEQREFVDGDGLRRVVGAAGRGRAHHQESRGYRHGSHPRRRVQGGGARDPHRHPRQRGRARGYGLQSRGRRRRHLGFPDGHQGGGYHPPRAARGARVRARWPGSHPRRDGQGGPATRGADERVRASG